MKWRKPGHEFDRLGNMFVHSGGAKPILIYGAGHIGTVLCQRLQNLGIVDGFIDHDEEKQKTGYLGLPVYDPEQIFQGNPAEPHIIVVALYPEKTARRILLRLTCAGYLPGVDCFWFEEFGGDMSVALPVYGMYVLDKVILSSVGFIPCDRCNLNCRTCLNFTPYLSHFTAKPMEQNQKDIDLLFQWMDNTLHFEISGGEPLLYPQLDELIAYIGENYRQKMGVFETVTNGTVIPSHEICELMKKYDMTVHLDNYTMAIPKELDRREKVIERFNEHEIQWNDNTVSEWVDLDVMHTDHSDMTEEQMAEFFDFCNVPWHTHEYGVMYTCNYAHFAERAGLYKTTDNEKFDLRKMTKERRREFLEFTLNFTQKGYSDFCRKCAGWGDCNTKRVPVAVQAERRKKIEK